MGFSLRDTNTLIDEIKKNNSNPSNKWKLKLGMNTMRGIPKVFKIH